MRVHEPEPTSMESYPPPTQTMLDRGDTTAFCHVRYVSVWSSCYQRQLRYIALEAPFTGIRQAVPTYFSWVSFSPFIGRLDCTLYYTARGNNGYYSIDQHDESPSLSVKTRNNRTSLHDSPLSNNSRVATSQTTPETAICLFVCSARGYIR